MTYTVNRTGAIPGGGSGGVTPTPPGTVAARPTSITGELQSWTETFVPSVVRSDMESLDIKVRRRTTGIQRTGDASVTLKAAQYADFRKWFEVDCMGGVLPSRFVLPPGCAPEVWRFASPPVISWLAGKVAFQATFKLEQMPAWKNLV